MLGAVIAQAVFEGLMGLMGIGFERRFRKSRARRRFVVGTLLLFSALFMVASIIVGVLAILKGPSMFDRFAAAFMVIGCVTALILLGPKTVQRFRSPPIQE